MKVLCINASNKPKQIPDDQWIKEGETYTVTRIVRPALQQGVLGLILKEIKLIDCFPYEFYNSDRFIPINETLDREKEETVKEADLDSLV